MPPLVAMPGCSHPPCRHVGKHPPGTRNTLAGSRFQRATGMDEGLHLAWPPPTPHRGGRAVAAAEVPRHHQGPVGRAHQQPAAASPSEHKRAEFRRRRSATREAEQRGASSPQNPTGDIATARRRRRWRSPLGQTPALLPWALPADHHRRPASAGQAIARAEAGRAPPAWRWPFASSPEQGRDPATAKGRIR